MSTSVPGKAWLQPRDLSFFDHADRLALLSRQGDPLERLNAVVDWQLFAPALADLLPPAPAQGPGGRPAFPHLLLCKILLLQRLYSLSDEQTQYQILDRYSFARFLGLTPADPVPDQNTIRTFRERLGAAGAARLFAAFNEHLHRQGLLPREGVIVDATFVEVPRQRNPRAENEQLQRGETPAAWSAQKAAHKDVDARWTQKNGARFFGYKNHVKINRATKLITAAVVTPASVHDSQVLGQLVAAGDDYCVADSAYSGRPVERQLAAVGVAGLIVQKAARNRPLTRADKADNRASARLRARGRASLRRDERRVGADLSKIYRTGAQPGRDPADEPGV